MLFRQDILQGIAEGRVTLAFRRWRKAPAGRRVDAAIAGRRALVRSRHRHRRGRHHARRCASHGHVARRAARVDGGWRHAASDRCVSWATTRALRLRASRPIGRSPGRSAHADASRRRSSRRGRQRYLRLIADRPGVAARLLAPQVGLGSGALQAARPAAQGARSHREPDVGYRLSPRGQAVLSSLA